MTTGLYGTYGGRYVPETLIPALDELEREWLAARDDPGFEHDLERLLPDYAGRPTPLYRAQRLEKALDTPAHIYYKYEGVSPAGSHKPNTAVAHGGA